MSEKSAARTPPANPERDTLRSIDHQFLRDQLETLLASHTPRGSDPQTDDAEQAGSDTVSDERGAGQRDNERGADARLLRDAILAAGRSA